METKKAQVYQSTGSYYEIKDEEGQLWRARLKGRFKISKHASRSNPIAVGDWVKFDIVEKEDNEAIIDDILLRDNYIIRTSPQNRHQKHIIASNVDLACLIITASQPITSMGFIDRFLITTQAFQINNLLVVNKADLLKGEVLKRYELIKETYEAVGFEVILVSAESGEGIEELKNHIKDKTVLFTGHSGVGKSTLINSLIPSFNLKVGKISDGTGKGRHTTTFAEMFDMPDRLGGKIIDTPGIKEWGLQEVEQEELSHYFPEMVKLLNECRFDNCLHVREPQCAVKDAVESGEIPVSRYENYLIFLEELERPF